MLPALFVMLPENAHGPDGMTVLFYQKFWDIVKGDLARIVNEFFFQDIMAQGLNDANILSHSEEILAYRHGPI